MRSKNRLNNIYQYAKYVIHNEDLDCDFEYLLSLLAWKAERMLALMQEDRYAHSPSVIRQLKYLIYLLHRYPKEHNDVMQKFWDQYPEVSWIPEEREKIDPRITKTLITTLDEAALAQAKIKQRIFRHMERYLERWWT